MIDSFNREINYLRLSLTSRCQQQCTYCSKSHGGECVKENELTTEDCIKIARVFATLGFRKIRLTGGEPLLRKDLCKIISGIKQLNKYDDIALTTNGMLLEERAKEIREAGLMRLNISVDSIKEERYHEITGGSLSKVLRGIISAKQVGFSNIKYNVVLIKGINDDEIDDMIAVPLNHQCEVRFIELMPMGDNKLEGVSNDEIIEKHPFLYPLPSQGDGVSTTYTAEYHEGTIGFISPISHPACKTCNRLRVTNDGYIRPCLGNNMEISIKEALKGSDEELKKVFMDAILQKPEKNSFEENFTTERKMNRIGG